MKREIVVIAHNLRSCENVGSLLRTADGLGVSKIYLTGYTPYPKKENDDRLPYLAAKIDKRISKSSLGSEKFVKWSNDKDIEALIKKLKGTGYKILALEQSAKSVDLQKYEPEGKMAVILGRETLGIEPEVIEQADQVISIPMLGKKESFNVTQAAAMTLYRLRYC